MRAKIRAILLSSPAGLDLRSSSSFLPSPPSLPPSSISSPIGCCQARSQMSIRQFPLCLLSPMVARSPMDCRRLRISLEIGSHFLYFKKGKFSTVRIAHQVSQRADRHVVPHSICVDPAHSQFPFSKAAAVHLFHASFRASPPCLSCLPFPLISRSLCGRRGQRKLFYRFQFAHT